MTIQTTGKIFLADQRGLKQTAAYQRYSTFHFADYVQEHKEAPGALAAFNEEALAGGESLPFTVTQATHVVIIPITGALDFLSSDAWKRTVEVEEVLVCTLPASGSFRLINPYPADIISYLQIWVTASESPEGPASHVYKFDFTSIENTLSPIMAAGPDNGPVPFPFSLHLGRFAGRQEALYQPKRGSALFFGFVIAGAFEVEGRLLHEKDGLALWDAASIEVEALSNNALLLGLELEQG
jgi:hypothetical protein